MRKEYKNNLDDEVLRIKIDDEENRIRKVISSLLYSYLDDLTTLLHSLARIDILISKAIQIKKEGMCLPKFAMKSSYKGMFNPEVKFILSKTGKKFQKIDFFHDFGVPTTIIGANMGGKTVVLKTLTLCQYMFQFGFGVPADESNMAIFDEIHFCIGDEQSEHKGLSSFAAEMLRIDNVLKSVKREVRLFALIDEPARTTNPIEGRALVSALLKILYGKKNLDLVMTTHYNVDNGEMCWRVKGLIDGKMNYSLLRTKSNEVPHEALNIAAELGIDQLWLEEAKHYLFNL
jgi:dsDNA-specific endonuclease/ATPase MutS2